MDVATLIVTHRRRAGLSQRELARRAGTSGAAICQYERGERVPRVDTLHRIVAATGGSLSLSVVRPSGPDPETNGRALIEVLGLADAMPKRSDRVLRMPPLRSQVQR